jgi:hypothetical protein
MAQKPKKAKVPTWDDCHYVGDDGKAVKVTITGDLLDWKALLPPKRHKPEKKRGCITMFSRAARLRMLCFVSKIDWKKSLPGLFLTCTYPDSIRIERRGQLNMHRQLFWRYMETFLDKKTAALWRIEWKARITGDHVGQHFPHYHFLIFNTPFISIEKIYESWRQSISSREIPVCWIEKIDSGPKAGSYVAKYSAKDDCLLDDVAYHNTIPGGRNWGILRKPLVNLERSILFRVKECAKTQEIRLACAAARKTGVILENESFRLLGDRAKLIISSFLESTLDREILTD